jgi:hypothetical protein
MSNSISDQTSFKYCCIIDAQNPEFSDFVQLLLKNQQETHDNIRSLQKSIAGLREQVEDFRAEHSEDYAEVKCLLHDLRRNKVWIPRERI